MKNIGTTRERDGKRERERERESEKQQEMGARQRL